MPIRSNDVSTAIRGENLSFPKSPCGLRFGANTAMRFPSTVQLEATFGGSSARKNESGSQRSESLGLWVLFIFRGQPEIVPVFCCQGWESHNESNCVGVGFSVKPQVFLADLARISNQGPIRVFRSGFSRWIGVLH